MRRRNQPDVWGAIVKGFLLSITLNITAIVLLNLLIFILTLGEGLKAQYDFVYWYILYGVSVYQFLYVFPVIFWLKNTRRFEVMKGLIMGTIMTFLLMGSCFVLVASQPR